MHAGWTIAVQRVSSTASFAGKGQSGRQVAGFPLDIANSVIIMRRGHQRSLHAAVYITAVTRGTVNRRCHQMTPQAAASTPSAALESCMACRWTVV